MWSSEWSRLIRDSSENSTASHTLRRHLRWARDHRRRSAWWRGSRSVRTHGRWGRIWCSRKRLHTVLECIRRNPGMVRAVTLAAWKRLRKCGTLMYWSCPCDVTCGRPDSGLSLSLTVVWKVSKENWWCFGVHQTGEQHHAGVYQLESFLWLNDEHQSPNVTCCLRAQTMITSKKWVFLELLSTANTPVC